MKQTNQELFAKFEKIKNWMQGDIKAVISKSANFLTALGQVAYTEIIGSFITEGGKSCENFDAFFGRLGEKYANLLKRHNKGRHIIYDDLRCGLIHEYLVKRKPFTIYHSLKAWKDLKNEVGKLKIPFEGQKIKVDCGVMYLKDNSGKGSWHFINPRYFFDFQKALEVYWEEIKNPKNKKLRQNFFKRARTINLKNFEI